MGSPTTHVRTAKVKAEILHQSRKDSAHSVGGSLARDCRVTAGTRVRAVSRGLPVGGAEGVVIEWHGVAFQVELDGLGTHFFEPEELERVRD